MQKDSKNLTLEDGSQLQWFKKSYKNYLNKTVILYGRTNSGKSTIIDEIMYLCKDYIAVVVVICQSTITVESSSYFGKIPNSCIKKEATTDWLEEFMRNQKGKAALYNTANSIKTLRSVFNRVKYSADTRLEEECISNAEKYIYKIKNNHNLDFATKKENIKNIEDIRDRSLVMLYKKCIRENKIQLENSTDMTEEEICCVNYLDFNPNVMLIYDDCASMLKKWIKASPEIAEMFYNGRHYYITQIFGVQDDKVIDSELRKNARVSIFTSQQAATSNFERASNGYSKFEKKRSEICIKKVFLESRSERNYKKLVYILDEIDPFHYTIADIQDNFKMGCAALWEFDEKVNKLKGNTGNDNSFFNTYCRI